MSSEFDPLDEPTPVAPVPVQSRARTTPSPTPADAVRALGSNDPPRANTQDESEYRYMLRTYLLTFIAGCVICGSAIGTFVILGVYASWLVMFMVALLCFPILLGLGYGSINFSRKPLSALLGIGLLVGMFGGVIAGVSFSYYNEVAMLPIVNVNATDPQPLPSKDDDALLLFSPAPYVDVNYMWDACIDGCNGYLCVAPIVTSAAQSNITFWAACPYILDEPCRHQQAVFDCDGLWSSNFSSALLDWIDRTDYLAFVSAVGDSTLMYNLTTQNYYIVYWNEDPWNWAGSFWWLGWSTAVLSLITYFVIMVGCWLSCFHRMRPQLSMPEERSSLIRPAPRT